MSTSIKKMPGIKNENPSSDSERRTGVVKMIVSGDTIIVQEKKDNTFEDNQITLLYLVAGKLARRNSSTSIVTKDEPWAWDAREFLRQRLIGVVVQFTLEKIQKSRRQFGNVYVLSENAGEIFEENIAESLVMNGLVKVWRDCKQTAMLQNLIALEEEAKAEKKGMWSSVPAQKKVRKVIWNVDDPVLLVQTYNFKLVSAIIEHVRDGSTVRAILIPENQHILLMMSGIRCPMYELNENGKPNLSVEVPFFAEAKSFTEKHLLQRLVKIRLEAVKNSNLFGSIYLQKQNFAELLLSVGYAKIVEWSLAQMKCDVDVLRICERQAQDRKAKIWYDYKPTIIPSNVQCKCLNGVVVEVLNGHALTLQLCKGNYNKVYFSYIRAPCDLNQNKLTASENIFKTTSLERNKNFRPLYDVPFVFEAREFLRKNLMGQKVQCFQDYISTHREQMTERPYYTVIWNGLNVAEQLVSKGLASCITYRQSKERNATYETLLAVEKLAKIRKRGLHNLKNIAPMRINNLYDQPMRLRTQFFPAWKRVNRLAAIVEFVSVGSRMRLYITKDCCLVSFVLAGVICPCVADTNSKGSRKNQTEPFGEEALAFSRNLVLQRDVFVQIDSIDKSGTAVIGWMWTQKDVNLSIALVEEGLAQTHFSADKSDYCTQLKIAELNAKAAKKNIWKNSELNEVIVQDSERAKIQQAIAFSPIEEVIVTEVTTRFTFFAQKVLQGDTLEEMLLKLRTELDKNTACNTYKPKKGHLCAARYSKDNLWYRVRVTKVHGDSVNVTYIDYGNKETLPCTKVAALPTIYQYSPAFAEEYALALLRLPTKKDDKQNAINTLTDDILNKKLQMQVGKEVTNGPWLITLYDAEANIDIAKQLIADGLILVEQSEDPKFAKLLQEYEQLQTQAKHDRLGIWSTAMSFEPT